MTLRAPRFRPLVAFALCGTLLLLAACETGGARPGESGSEAAQRRLHSQLQSWPAGR